MSTFSRNHIMVNFAEWLKDYNSRIEDYKKRCNLTAAPPRNSYLPAGALQSSNADRRRCPLYHFCCSVGVYGLDLYSMYTSAHEVIHYLDDIDPSAAKLARRRSVSLFFFSNSASSTFARAQYQFAQP
jgi:erythromycin esterase-like protein